MVRLRRALAAGLALALSAASAPAQVVQERVDFSVVQRIKDEEMNRSKLDDLASYLTDVIGARLTNSTGSRKANTWAAETFRSWGLANVKVEAWDSAFGRGWDLVSYSGRILDPWIKPLAAYPQAWSGSTLDAKGRPVTITCPVVILDVKDSSDLPKYAGKLKGACVLRNAPPVVGPEPGSTALTFTSGGVSGPASLPPPASVCPASATPASGPASGAPAWCPQAQRKARKRARFMAA